MNAIPTGTPLCQTVVIPDSAGRHGFEFFLQSQAAGIISLDLILVENGPRLQQGNQQGPQGVAGANRPGCQAVDAGVKVVQPDMNPLQCIRRARSPGQWPVNHR